MNPDLVIQIFIPTTLATIMVAMGLGLTVDDFRRVAIERTPVAVGALAQIVLLPLLGFGIALLLQLPPPIAVGIVLVSACPGGPSSNLFSVAARGDRALSVSLTAISGLVTVLSTPLYLHLALTVFPADTGPVAFPFGETVLRILLVVALPLLAAMIFRHHRPAQALRWEPRVRITAALLLTVMVLGAVAAEASSIADYWAQAGSAVLLLMGAAMGAGFALSRLLALRPSQAITITIEVGMQNSALAIGIAFNILRDGEIAVPALGYGVLMYGACGIAVLLGRALVPAPEDGPLATRSQDPR